MNKYIKIGFAAAALSAAVPAFADEEIEEEGAVGWTPFAIGLAALLAILFRYPRRYS